MLVLIKMLCQIHLADMLGGLLESLISMLIPHTMWMIVIPIAYTSVPVWQYPMMALCDMYCKEKILATQHGRIIVHLAGTGAVMALNGIEWH